MGSTECNDGREGFPIGYRPMEETMGDRIQRLRKARGFSVEELARRLGVTQAAVYKWQVGDTRDIRNETLALLCKELATDLPYLVWGEDRAPKTPRSGPTRHRRSS